jgi:hypothetical protein
MMRMQRKLDYTQEDVRTSAALAGCDGKGRSGMEDAFHSSSARWPACPSRRDALVRHLGFLEGSRRAETVHARILRE